MRGELDGLDHQRKDDGLNKTDEGRLSHARDAMAKAPHYYALEVRGGESYRPCLERSHEPLG